MTDTTTPDLWQHVTAALDWVDMANPRTDHEIAMRVLKISEEAGEAAAAYIGMTGQNPRKGVTHTLEDVLGEFFDTAITSFVAAATVAGNAEVAQAALARHLARRGPRLAAAIILQHERAAAGYPGQIALFTLSEATR